MGGRHLEECWTMATTQLTIQGTYHTVAPNCGYSLHPVLNKAGVISTKIGGAFGSGALTEVHKTTGTGVRERFNILFPDVGSPPLSPHVLAGGADLHTESRGPDSAKSRMSTTWSVRRRVILRLGEEEF